MNTPRIRFYGGITGALIPFGIFLAGVTWLALSGAPDEKGFWPVLLAALFAGLALARDRSAYSDTLIRGMSQPVVMIMIMAWLLAGVFGAVMGASGFVQSLIWLAGRASLHGAGFVVAAYLICCVVSTATGTSLGTVLVCAPILYPAGGALGANPTMLIGAILAGATFGDSISPVSDTTIASAMTQSTDLAGTVRARVKYSVPAALLALLVYAVAGGTSAAAATGGAPVTGDPRGLPMIVAPVVALGLLLAKRHLLEGLAGGIVTALAIALAFGLITPHQVIFIDPARFGARGLIIDGMERAVGISIFTILLLGLVSGIEATGVLDRLIERARARIRSAIEAEAWIVGTLTVTLLLTTHSVVAILTVGDFTRQTGEAFGIHPYRRANLLDVTACTFPFLLPYCIPPILAASTTAAGTSFGLPRISPLAVGMANFYSWGFLLILIFAIVSGYGRAWRTDGKSE
jgi:Na+/H+ antiporter NhaC